MLGGPSFSFTNGTPSFDAGSWFGSSSSQLPTGYSLTGTPDYSGLMTVADTTGSNGIALTPDMMGNAALGNSALDGIAITPGMMGNATSIGGQGAIS